MAKRTQRRTGPQHWLTGSTTPLFLVDRRRRLVWMNAGCETLTGWTLDEVHGKVCEFHSEAGPADPAALTSSLCPPPEVLQGETRQVASFLVNRQGTSQPRMLNFYPLLDDQQQVHAVLGVVGMIEQPTGPAASSAARSLHAELAALRSRLHQNYGLRSIVGQAAAMQRVCAQVQLAAGSAVAVHLVGPAGSGRQHMARVIHHESVGRLGLLVPIECGRLPAHELRQTLRRLWDADHSGGGLQPRTVLLKDVDQLPRDIQQQLLDRTQEAGELRLMSTSRQELSELVAADQFLEPLEFLLTPLIIRLPPLVERGDDLLLLAQHFLEQQNRGHEKQVAGLAESTQDLLRQYNWPGQVAELQLVIREAWQACQDQSIQPEHLPFRFRTGLDAQAVPPERDDQPIDLARLLADVERREIQHALEVHRHNRSRAAEHLGITRARLYRRMESLGFDTQDQTDAD